MDNILYSIWAEIPRSQGGLDFSSVEIGAVSLLSCPMICFTMISCYSATKTKSGSYWLISTNLVLIGSIVVLPLCNVALIEHESRLFLTILVVVLKEGSYLLWQSSWNTIVGKVFPSSILGRTYSISYFFGHILLLISSFIYPRLMTICAESKFLKYTMGISRFAVFFGFLCLPGLITAGLTIKMKLIFKDRDGLEL